MAPLRSSSPYRKSCCRPVHMRTRRPRMLSRRQYVKFGQSKSSSEPPRCQRQLTLAVVNLEIDDIASLLPRRTPREVIRHVIHGDELHARMTNHVTNEPFQHH